MKNKSSKFNGKILTLLESLFSDVFVEIKKALKMPFYFS